MLKGAWFLFKKRSLQKSWQIGLFLSASTHFIYLLTACFQVGYPRYSMFMWPYLFMMFLTFIGIVFDCFKMKNMNKETYL